MPGRGARSGVDARRAAAVLLLLAVAAIGLRAGGAFSSAGSGNFLGISERALNSALSVAVSVLAVVGLILLVAGLIWRRKGEDGRPARKRASIWWVLLLPFFVFGLAHLIALLRSRGVGAHLGLRAGTGAAGRVGGHHPPPGSSWPVFALFAAVALAAGTLTWYRRRQSAVPVFAAPAEPTAPLADALAAGDQALRADSDPRAAIIGCYAAMERSLAEAGSPAEAADTPAEVLARATAGGLVQSSWAGTLTGLFRRARYSRQPMTEADRETAIVALAQVRADLDGAS